MVMCDSVICASAPGAPGNLVVAGQAEEGTTINWDEPTQNPSCVSYYRVCSRLDGEFECEEVSDDPPKEAK